MGLASQPRTLPELRSSARGFGTSGDQDARFIDSRAFRTSFFVSIQMGSSFAVAENQNGREGASNCGKSEGSAVRLTPARPSTSWRTRWNLRHPRFSSVGVDPERRRSSCAIVPSFSVPANPKFNSGSDCALKRKRAGPYQARQQSRSNHMELQGPGCCPNGKPFHEGSLNQKVFHKARFDLVVVKSAPNFCASGKWRPC